MDNLTVIESKPFEPATVASIAAIKFLGEEDLKDVSREELHATINERMHDLRLMLALALSILQEDKETTVAKMKDDPEYWIEIHQHMEHVAEMTELALQFLRAGGMRMLVALATVVNSTPPDDGGGGEEDPAEEVAA